MMFAAIVIVFVAQQAPAPSSQSSRLVLANTYLMAGRLTDALRETDAVLQIDPLQPTALKLKGNLAYLLDDFDAAENAFIKLLDGHPSDEEGAYMLGRIYYQESRVDQAAGLFERVLKIDPKSYKAYDNLGLCFEARGETDKAIRYFLTAIKLVDKDHPEYEWPFANLANLFLETGDPEKAFALASKAADRNPRSARNFYIGGKALCKLNKMDLCVNWLQRSVALDTNYPEPLYLLASVYRTMGRDAEANEVRERFLAIKAKQPGKRK